MGDILDRSAGGEDERESFVSNLRWALRHLFDPDLLPKSPLVGLFGLTAHPDPLILQRVLLEAIDGIRPPGNELPQHAKIWRTYRCLYHRYSEQLPQAEVARALGLSKRQMHRLENKALHALAARLQAQYSLQDKTSRRPAVEREPRGPAGDENSCPTEEQELRWLEESLPDELATADAVLRSAIQVVSALAQARNVRLTYELAEGIAHLAVPRDAVRQAVLTLFTAAICAVPDGCVAIRSQSIQQQMQVDVHPAIGHPMSEAPSREVRENLEMARKLTTLCGGALEINWEPSAKYPFTTRLVVPGHEEATVLVVDDNADALRLFERYLVGTHYEFVGIREPQRVLELAARSHPQLIVLDIMLPGVDGWELLGNLRRDPDTQDTPVIVCSILPEESLALTLGATAFLRKPVNRSNFLAALDAQTIYRPSSRRA